MAEALNPGGEPLLLGDVQLVTPGLAGQAELYPAGVPGMRAEEQSTDAFHETLRRVGAVQQMTVVISGATELGTSSGTRGGGGGDEVVVNVPAPGDGFAQVLLYTAEDGTQTWHLPQEGAQRPGAMATRGSARLTYRVPRAVFPPQGVDPATRGLLAALGKKILTVIAFRLVETGVEFVAEKIATRWEEKNRPYRLRSFTPDDYTGAGADLTAQQAAGMTGGRALLFVHGTFSLASSAFGGLPQPVFTKLSDAYEGRVLAFDHPTLSQSPTDNARRLGEMLRAVLPAGQALRADVVTHSRGGLVVREACEYAGELGLADVLDVERVVMVGVPNAGTALADVAHWKALIDRMTNILQFMPDNPVTDVLDAVLTVLEHLAVGAVRGLDGLTAMDPQGPYLRERLNGSAVATTARYFAVASDYHPAQGSPLLRVATDGAVDLVFGDVPNDLVVPRDGVFTVAGCTGFPIAQPLLFGRDAAVTHLGYWSETPLADELPQWLAREAVGERSPGAVAGQPGPAPG